MVPFYVSIIFIVLVCFGDCRDVCFLFSIMELDGTLVVVLKVLKKKQSLQEMSLSMKHDPVIPKIIHRLCYQQFHVFKCFLSTKLHCIITSGSEARAHDWVPFHSLKG